LREQTCECGPPTHPPEFGGFDARTTYLNETSSGWRKYAKTQARPTEERFLLKVDGQIKRSFSSKEAAATSGAVVKKAYPVVAVTVVDTEKHTTEIIKP
jgi:hypothetical protein